jgi:hypothetical protein
VRFHDSVVKAEEFGPRPPISTRERPLEDRESGEIQRACDVGSAAFSASRNPTCCAELGVRKVAADREWQADPGPTPRIHLHQPEAPISCVALKLNLRDTAKAERSQESNPLVFHYRLHDRFADTANSEALAAFVAIFGP